MDYRLPLIILFGASIQLAACSEDSSSTTAPVPPNAIVVDSSNASTLATLARDIGTALLDSQDLLNDINAFASCTGGSVTSSGSSTATSYTGTVTFSDCIVNGVTINGTINVNGTFNSSDDYTDNVNGNLSGNYTGGSFNLNNIAYSESGNASNGNYSINTFSFSYAPPAGGFAFNLQAPITGNSNQNCPDNPASGVILVTGANNTQGKATIANQVVTVEVNTGSGFQPVTGPFFCSNFF